LNKPVLLKALLPFFIEPETYLFLIIYTPLL